MGKGKAGGGLWRRVRREQAGFTLIELISAMLVTTIGVIALVTTLDGSRELMTFSEQRETAMQVAEKELERIQSLSYGSIALTGSPEGASQPVCAQGVSEPCADPTEPAYYATSGFYRWNQEAASGEASTYPVPRCTDAGMPKPNCEPLVVDSGAGAVTPAVTALSEDGPQGQPRLRLQLQRFVTWADDTCPSCTGTQDYKRVSVAVRVVGHGDGRNRLAGGQQRPVVITTLVSDPRAGG